MHTIKLRHLWLCLSLLIFLQNAAGKQETWSKEELADQVRACKTTDVHKYLQEQQSFDPIVTDQGETPLMLSARFGCIVLTRLLLRSGADPNRQDDRGMTSVMHAVLGSNNQKDILEILIANKADTNIVDNDNQNALFFVADDILILEILLKAGTNTNQPSEPGGTPLAAAAQYCCVPCINLMLANGADVNAGNRGITAVVSAVQSGCEKGLRQLLKHNARVEDPLEEKGYRPLHIAAANNKPGCVKQLLQAGASQTILSNEGSSAIYLAVKHKSHQCLDLLLENLAKLPKKEAEMLLNQPTVNINSINSNAVLLSALQGDSRSLTKLLRAGANLEFSFEMGGFNPIYSRKFLSTHNTVLAIAAFTGKAEAIKVLVEAGADVNSKNSAGATPLMHSARNDCIECLITLINAKGDLNATDIWGNTALHIAVEFNRANLIKSMLLFQASPNVPNHVMTTPLIRAIHLNHLESLRVLIENPETMNSPNKLGITPLMFAFHENKTNVIELMAEMGATPYTSSLKNWGPLLIPERYPLFFTLFGGNYGCCQFAIVLYVSEAIDSLGTVSYYCLPSIMATLLPWFASILITVTIYRYCSQANIHTQQTLAPESGDMDRTRGQNSRRRAKRTFQSDPFFNQIAQRPTSGGAAVSLMTDWSYPEPLQSIPNKSGNHAETQSEHPVLQRQQLECNRMAEQEFNNARRTFIKNMDNEELLKKLRRIIENYGSESARCCTIDDKPLATLKSAMQKSRLKISDIPEEFNVLKH